MGLDVERMCHPPSTNPMFRGHLGKLLSCLLLFGQAPEPEEDSLYLYPVDP
jgi:hypothetical protein